jgi:branched-chain amino acid transport system substrate-binding protein
MRKSLMCGVVIAAFFGAVSSAAAQGIPVGHLATYTGPTSDVGVPYGQGVADAMAYINLHGGVNGKILSFETSDYGYNAPRAVATYKRWMATSKPIAVQGWGTADTEALVQFVSEDKVFFMSASYSGHLTDPTGKAPRSKSAAPFNFFYGPSYSDACRGLVQWAASDWKAKGKSGKPKFIHMGDNHPYPNAPKDACAEYAVELGFVVLPAIVYSLRPADAKAQCLSLKDSGADYAYLGNTSGSNVSLLKSCGTVGVKTQFMTNVWGWDENAIAATGADGNGVVWPVSAATWTDSVPGMTTVREISKMSDPAGTQDRQLHYMRGICTTFLMRDAMVAADKAGQLNGPGLKAAMEKMTAHVPAGLDGVCLPSTWTPEDHRGMMQVLVYRSEVKGDAISKEKLATIEVPRRFEWLGW